MKIERSALVSFSAQQMFDLVNDIESYPLYMDGCQAAEVLARGDDFVEARLTLGKGPAQYSFVTRNQLNAPSVMDMHLVDGPFKSFSGGWHFQPLNEQACKVSLQLQFEFKSRLIALAVGKKFESVANNLVGALCQRAERLYAR